MSTSTVRFPPLKASRHPFSAPLIHFQICLPLAPPPPLAVMLLKAPQLASSSSVSLPAGVAGGGRFRFPCSYLKLTKGESRRGSVLAAAEGSQAITGVVFQPFEELKKIEASLVPIALDQSLARQKYTDDCEAAINVQINVEYNVSYVYHALFAYFDRDNVALNGLAKFFKESSDEEREHAEKLIKYQNKRGGRAKLLPIVTPPTEFDHAEKGDALYAMELALALEKLTNEKLLQLHTVAQNSNDPQLTDFIESEFLEEQAETIKNVSEYVAQLRRVGKGHGVWHFDQMLLHEGDAA